MRMGSKAPFHAVAAYIARDERDLSPDTQDWLDISLYLISLQRPHGSKQLRLVSKVGDGEMAVTQLPKSKFGWKLNQPFYRC